MGRLPSHFLGTYPVDLVGLQEASSFLGGMSTELQIDFQELCMYAADFKPQAYISQ